MACWTLHRLATDAEIPYPSRSSSVEFEKRDFISGDVASQRISACGHDDRPRLPGRKCCPPSGFRIRPPQRRRDPDRDRRQQRDAEAGTFGEKERDLVQAAKPASTQVVCETLDRIL
jgi:hypothetical protein